MLHVLVWFVADSGGSEASTASSAGTDGNRNGNESSASTSAGPPNKIQKTMAAYLPRKLGASEKEKIDNLLLNMVAIDCQPFSLVGDEGFKSFVAGLNPSYELPSRKILSTRLLDAEYEKRLGAIKQMVRESCDSICLTVDCWTSKTMTPYMAVTGHFIHKKTLKFSSILLQCCVLEGSHTGAHIAEAIKSVANEWQINEKVNFWVSDNASNMLSAAHILEPWPHFGCYAHKLNLVAQSALSIPTVSSTLTKVQKTVAHFKRSSQAKEKLLRYQIVAQETADGNALSLISSVPTRWNSSYLMLLRFSKLQEAIRATMPNLNVDLPLIPVEEFRCIEQMCEVLKPLHEATLILSGDQYLTASKAIVVTQGLISVYNELLHNRNNFFDPVRILIRKIKTEISTRFNNLDTNMPIATCTFLDPRFKQHAFYHNENVVQDLKTYIVNEIVRCNSSSSTADLPVETSVQNPGTSRAEELSIWRHFDAQVTAAYVPQSAFTKAEEEMDSYSKQAVVPRSACPSQWWQEHKNIYPSLYKMFVNHCNIIVTSVPCERAFSKAGHIISDRRTRLTSSKVSKLMFLHGNKKV